MRRIVIILATLLAFPAAATADPAILAAGDIASSGSGDSSTAAVVNANPGLPVLTLGDNAYDSGTLSEFNSYYGPTWGAFKSRTHLSIGNHEMNSGGSGYYDYFGSLAGPRNLGYYSYDIGTWHIVALNSQIAHNAGSTQEQWLRADLKAHPTRCQLMYWHQPRFSSGNTHGNDTSQTPFWAAGINFWVDVVLNGHDHDYERFGLQDGNGNATSLGMREFVVGTGGVGNRGFGTVKANSQYRNSSSLGVLKLTLHPTGYDWQFLRANSGTNTDAGSGTCR